ncbi:MAG: GNAT family N-acetyltransferase [Propionibacteriaceae bacterium]|jgi:ribosomal protein S18 acetylase RimI-like enzyme|nr:GNAT family N-acetyltransferase [Propionibacteriaceae bacterium]
MKIRNLKLTDYEAVYALWCRSAGMGLNDVDDSREGIAKYLARNPNTCFVAEAETDAGIVGAILSGHDGRRGFIYHTCVAPEMRRNGLGAQLVTAALEALRTAGISKVALVIFGHNTSGNAFWERLGFTPRPDLTYRNRPLIALERIDT